MNEEALPLLSSSVPPAKWPRNGETFKGSFQRLKVGDPLIPVTGWMLQSERTSHFLLLPLIVAHQMVMTEEEQEDESGDHPGGDIELVGRTKRPQLKALLVVYHAN